MRACSSKIKSLRGNTLKRSDVVSDSCAVEDTRLERLYLIGGSPDYSRVRRYPDQLTFPPLRWGRFGHACAGFYKDDQFVLLVMGGTDAISHG